MHICVETIVEENKMSEKQQLTDETRSRLTDLFGEDYIFQDIHDDEKARLYISNQKITFDDVQACILQQLPLIAHAKKNDDIVNKLQFNDLLDRVDAIHLNLRKLATVDKPYIIKLTRAIHNDSCIITEEDGSVRIDINCCNVAKRYDNGVIRINTGLILEMPRLIRVHGKMQIQQPFVIIPRVISKRGSFVQTVFARDPEDTGLLAICGITGGNEDVLDLSVYLDAYLTFVPDQQIQLINIEQKQTNIFKPKDMSSDRLVKNLHVKTRYETGQKDDDRGKYAFETYDATKKPTITYEKQKLLIQAIDGRAIFFASRKREWKNADLLTLPGYLSETDVILPDVAKGSMYEANTHCLVFLKNKIPLTYTMEKEIQNGTNKGLYKISKEYKILNGAFCDILNYSILSKRCKQIVTCLKNLRSGCKACSNICAKNANFDKNQLLLIFDHHKSIFDKDPKLREMMCWNEKQIFATKPHASCCYSAMLYRGLLAIVTAFMPDKFTEDGTTTIATKRAAAEEEVVVIKKPCLM